MDPVRAITIAGLCLFLLGAFLTWQAPNGEAYSVLLLFPVIAIAGAYALAPQLRWWYWQRYGTPDLDPALAPLLDRFDLYRRLDLEGKREFRRRTFLLRENTELSGNGIPELPPELPTLVAASAATVSFYADGEKDFLFDPFQTVVFYLHPFATPNHETLHITESHVDDGAIIWALEVFVRSVVEPRQYLHLGLYEWGRVRMHLRPQLRRKLEHAALTFGQIRKIADFREQPLREYIGLEPDRAAITLALYFTHAERFAQLHPDHFAEVRAALGRPDPIEISQLPVR